MSQVKQTAKRKRRRKAVPLLGAAGLSLSLTGAASAMPDRQPVEPLAGERQATHEIIEVSDISLATFYVTDREDAGAARRRTRLAIGSCGGCGCGCGGACGGCWTGTYYTYPIFGDAPAPPPKAKSSHTRKTKPQDN